MEPTAAHNQIPNGSEAFGSVRKDAESFGTVPNVAEAFRNVPKPSERKENHTLTVREVARLFEAAGVARTERSIINWCRPNKDGVARLDYYFDPNERKDFISPQSVELAIQEEQAKAARTSDPSEPVGNVPKVAQEDKSTTSRAEPSEDTGRIKSLEQEVLDLKIMNKGKDYFIDQLKTERQSLVQEQQVYVERLMSSSHEIGELKTKLLQLGTSLRSDESREAEGIGGDLRV